MAASKLAFPSPLPQNSILPPEWHKKLTSLYTEPIRSYHTLEHISSLLALLEQHSGDAYDRASIEWAIWFHDAIYDPQSTVHGSNEEFSSELLQDLITNLPTQSSLPSTTQLRKVTNMIRATIDHLPPPDLPPEELSDLKLFLDFDLEILSRTPEEYSRYSAQIRKEYVHYPDSSYRLGRKNVLTKFLARERIYFSGGEVWQEREVTARKNIKWEIEQLGEVGGGLMAGVVETRTQ